MGMLHVSPRMTRRTVKRFKARFNGFEVMCLEIISEGANRNLKAFLPTFSSCPVKLTFRTDKFKRIKSP